MARVPAVVSVVIVLSLPVLAAEPELSLREYVKTTWTHRDGIPIPSPTNISQTTDGYLWFVSERTLIRFDGARFVAMEDICPVSSIAAGIAGSLWIFCREPEYRLLRRESNGQLTELPISDSQVRQGTGTSLFFDSQQRLWIYGRVVTRVERDGSFREVVRVDGGGVRSIVEDSTGAIWLSTDTSFIRIQHDRIERLPNSGAAGFASGLFPGIVFCQTTAIGQSRGTARTTLVHAPPGVAFHITRGCAAVDRSGGVWVGTLQQGLARIRDGRLEASLQPEDPDSQTSAVFIDREDNIWVGSSAGLHRFRRPYARLLPLLGIPVPERPLAVFIDSRQDIWIAGTNAAARVNPQRDIDQRFTGFQVFAFGEDAAGRVWLATQEDVAFVERGTIRMVRDRTSAPVRRVKQFRSDASGELWAVADQIGIYQITPGPPRLAFDIKDASSDLLFSSREGLWVGTRNGVRQFKDGKWIAHDFRENPTFYAALCLAEIGNAIWFGDAAGLRRWRNGRWTTWTAEHGLPSGRGVQEIADDGEGRLWLMSYGGILGVSYAELDQTPDGAPQPLRFVQIGALDRVVAHPGTLTPSPRVARDPAGRLYFATKDSVAVVDPSTLRESGLRPAILLESVTVDNHPIDASVQQRLTEPSRLQFDYTSLSLRSPENIRFRYRLEGYEEEWIEAGSTRQVTYGTLRPGAYRFRVTGSGSGGVWNDEGASFAFDVIPRFYNTWWFRSLVAACLGAVLIGAHRLRVRRFTRQMQVRFDERLAERTRIAQDLHDTLLQGTLAAAMHAQVANDALDDAPPLAQLDAARTPLRRAIQLLSQVADDGRATLKGLRSAGASADLPEVLHQVAGAQANHREIDFRVIVEGAAVPLSPPALDTAGKIASEAIVNAFKHSNARRVEAELVYTPNAFTCVVRDDGLGIQQEVLEHGRDGHWGLTGMRERAERAGGSLHVRSRAAAGTEVEFSLEARLRDYEPASSPVVAGIDQPRNASLDACSVDFDATIASALPQSLIS